MYFDRGSMTLTVDRNKISKSDLGIITISFKLLDSRDKQAIE